MAWVRAVNGATVTLEDYSSDYSHHYATYSTTASRFTGYIHFRDIG